MLIFFIVMFLELRKQKKNVDGEWRKMPSICINMTISCVLNKLCSLLIYMIFYCSLYWWGIFCYLWSREINRIFLQLMEKLSRNQLNRKMSSFVVVFKVPLFNRKAAFVNVFSDFSARNFFDSARFLEKFKN